MSLSPLQICPEAHGGFGCTVVEEAEERVLVECHNGVVDIV